MSTDTLSLRVLVIDDDPNIHADFRKCFANRVDDPLRKLEERLFQGIRPATSSSEPNYAVDYCSQGYDGYMMVADHITRHGASPYAVIFVDMRMPPGWDGLTTLSALWQLDKTLPLVICTAYSDYSREEIDQRFGTSESLVYLPKPFTPPAVRQLTTYFAKKRGLLQAG